MMDLEQLAFLSWHLNGAGAVFRQAQTFVAGEELQTGMLISSDDQPARMSHGHIA